jgi:hypothetical protein
MLKKLLHSLSLFSLILAPIILFSCTKKYDWVCTCKIYKDTSTITETKELKHMIKPDADRECAKFGNDVAPTNSVHECDVK